ncbi:Sulfate transport system permease protein CysW [Pelotomaculum propionicicum]|uniref:Sulfate transport system permease protein CysW n=2 Tax=Pelotomaculum propionicicum TaxID=258475 RepID=A0A4Y7RR07_9FIRM|nr:ABC transporter permease subunit [Peptococcaceae bacterium]TEB11445.1 Sulfate transport system permease protein CysW [Pelotomaculum propionicicum]
MTGTRVDFFRGMFWLIFVLFTVFMIILISGLLFYGEWAAFLSVIRNPEFRFAVVFTLWTSLIAIALAAVVAIPSGFILSRYNFPGKVLVDTLLDMPIVLPPLVSGLALLILFGPILGNALVSLGLDVVFSARGVVVAQWFIATPFAVKTFKQAFDAIDPRLENVARTLGYSPAEVFLRVTMPLARGGILGGLTMAWSRALGEFGATAMLAGITRMKTETLSVAIFLNMTIGDMEFAIATAVIMLLVALVLMSFFKVFTGTGVRL